MYTQCSQELRKKIVDISSWLCYVHKIVIYKSYEKYSTPVYQDTNEETNIK